MMNREKIDNEDQIGENKNESPKEEFHERLTREKEGKRVEGTKTKGKEKPKRERENNLIF
ncbi:MAG: hypothetical protein ACFE9R_13965 [Candidatus Hermodarchaeota archaeon]